MANLLDTDYRSLRYQYGCQSTRSEARFEVKGAMIVAIRFFRADVAESGRIELYIVAPDGLEEWLRYADRDSELDRLARRFIGVAEGDVSPSVAERFSQIDFLN